MTHRRLFVVCSLAALAAGCGVPAPRAAPDHGVATGRIARPVDGGTAPADGTAYRVDPERSELRLLVYRGGPLANLGHNHVIVNRQLDGAARYVPALVGSTLQLSIPVAAFSVDDSAARAVEGADFQGAVPEDARSGTWRNMTGAALLDVAHHATIELRSTAITRIGDAAATATFEAAVAGRTAVITVPLSLSVTPNEITVTGAVTLKQTDLGLTPFSIMLGAIQVQDEIRVKFTVVAVPAG